MAKPMKNAPAPRARSRRGFSAPVNGSLSSDTGTAEVVGSDEIGEAGGTIFREVDGGSVEGEVTWMVEGSLELVEGSIVVGVEEETGTLVGGSVLGGSVEGLELVVGGRVDVVVATDVDGSEVLLVGGVQSPSSLSS